MALLSGSGKVFVWIILERVRHHLLEHQHLKQSSFTQNRSTIDQILALWVLTECRQEFQQGLLSANINLHKVLHSENQDAFWRILSLRGVPLKLINLIFELYSGTKSAVMCGGSISDLFPVVAGVCQGSVLAPTLFSICMDEILERISESYNCGASFGNVKISDVDFVDDAASLQRLWISLWGSSRC